MTILPPCPVDFPNGTPGCPCSPPVPSDSVVKFKHFAQVAASAYCKDIAKNWNFNCGKRCEGELQGTTVEEAILDEKTQASGYVAFNNSSNTIIASFRGTVDLINGLNDTNLIRVKVDFLGPSLEGAFIHDGFQTTYLHIREKIQTALAYLAKNMKSGNCFYRSFIRRRTCESCSDWF